MGKTITIASPKVDKMEEWVHGNTETRMEKETITERSPKKVKVTKKVETAPIETKTVNLIQDKQQLKRLTIDLPVDTHKAFKMKAMTNDVTMVEMVNKWVHEYVGS